MVAFAGYALPVQYPAGLMAEHAHTRSAANLFDVSHMGQLLLRGMAWMEPVAPDVIAKARARAAASTGGGSGGGSGTQGGGAG